MFVKLALDEQGQVKIEGEGEAAKPLYVNDKGEEVAVDPPGMYKKILDLGQENKTTREKLEEVSGKLEIFKDIEDLEKWYADATKAIEHVKNFNDKEWLDTKKVESMKAQMKEAHDKELREIKQQFEEQIKSLNEANGKKDEHIRNLMVSNKFASCTLFSGSNPKTTMSADVAEAFFGHHFKVEEDEKSGKPIVRAYFDNGDEIYSASPDRVGEKANFEEAIQILFDNYPNRDQYLKSKKGSGAGGGAGDEEPTTDLAKLQKQYDQAFDAKNTPEMIRIKNRMAQIRQANRSGGRAA